MDLFLIGDDPENKQELLVSSAYTGGHIVVAHALYTIKYYNGSGNFRTDKYLEVATGMTTNSIVLRSAGFKAIL